MALRIIAVANQKGGCGKTTTCINLSAALALLQKKVLLIDFDPQGHSTCGLGLDSRNFPQTVRDLLLAPDQISDLFPRIIQKLNPFFDLLPCNETLSRLEAELSQCPDRDKRLKQLLEEISSNNFSYDYVMIDCPPNLGVLTFNAFEAADEVLIPVEPSFFSLHGLAKISETIESLNKHRARPLAVSALLSIFNSRTRFAKDIYDEVTEHFGERLFKTSIHESVLLKEAAGAGQSIVDYDPESQPCREFLNLAMELLEKEWERKLPGESLGWENKIRHHLGPKRVLGGILFQVLDPKAKYVEIVGDFNQWIPELMIKRDGKGLWQKVISLRSGTFRYKLIVDGEWQIDPHQPVQRSNDFGTVDSCLEIH